MFYLLFFSFFVACFLAYKLTEEIFFLYVFLFFIFIFSAFRFDAGFDFFIYVEMIQGEFDYSRVEFLSSWLIDLAVIFENPQVFFIASSLIYLIAIIYALKIFSCLSFVSVFVFCFGPLSLLASFGLVREYLAISFFFMSIAFLYKNRFFWSVISIFAAVLFHKSAAIFIPLLFLRTLLCTRFNLVYYFAVLVFSFFVFGDIILYISKETSFYYHYFEQHLSSSGYKLFLILFSFFIFNAFVISISDFKSERLWLSFNVYFLGVTLYAGLLAFGEHLARIAYYFIPFLYVLVHSVFYSLSFKSRILYIVFVFIFCVFSFIGTLYSASNNLDRDFLNNYNNFIFMANPY